MIIFEPLLIYLNNFVSQLENGMELQLLNLFKIILQKTALLEFFQRDLLHNQSQNLLIPILSSGLNSQSTYVQAVLINFITMCFPVFTELFSEQILLA